jgi:hypothetical protein
MSSAAQIKSENRDVFELRHEIRHNRVPNSGAELSAGAEMMAMPEAA